MLAIGLCTLSYSNTHTWHAYILTMFLDCRWDKPSGDQRSAQSYPSTVASEGVKLEKQCLMLPDAAASLKMWIQEHAIILPGACWQTNRKQISPQKSDPQTQSGQLTQRALVYVARVLNSLATHIERLSIPVLLGILCNAMAVPGRVESRRVFQC